MKKTTILIFLINVFLLMVFNVLEDYQTLKDKTQNIYSTISNSTDASISAVLSAEEFFSDSSVYSSRADSQASVTVWNGIDFTSGNMYMLSFYMSDLENYMSDPEKSGAVPSQSAYSSYVNKKCGGGNPESYIYSQLYGDPASGVPTEEFGAFYNNIGSFYKKGYLLSTTSFARDTLDSRFTSAVITYPTLSRMGLNLSHFNTDGRYKLGASDQFTSVENYGANGVYYLTPASLGITYLNEDLLRNTLYCMLDTSIRCNKVSNISTASFASADGTLPTQVFTGGAGGASQEARNDSRHTIVNDGQVEYFMDTLDVDVTYYLVDFFNNKNWEIVNYIEGSSAPLGDLPQRLREKSTHVNKDGSKPTEYWVVVAKVDVTIDLAIPHQSSILQWNRYRNSSGSNEFYGILGLDGDGLETSDDGLQYRYTTFTAITE